MNESEVSELVSGARRLGLEVGRDQACRLARYLDLLYQWNRSAGLTRIERADGVRLHLIDSISAVPLLEGVRTLADVGSGGGLPGIPIAVVVPGTHVRLVESKRRRCSFLRHVVSVLELENCEVVEADATRLVGPRPLAEAVIARAFSEPSKFLTLASQLVGPRGVAVVMGGASLPERELDALASSLDAAAEARRRFVLPGGTEKRILVRYRFGRGRCFT